MDQFGEIEDKYLCSDLEWSLLTLSKKDLSKPEKVNDIYNKKWYKALEAHYEKKDFNKIEEDKIGEEEKEE